MIKKMFLYLFIRFGITTSWPEQKQSYPFTSLKTKQSTAIHKSNVKLEMYFKNLSE